MLSEFENDDALLIEQLEQQFNETVNPPKDEDDRLIGISQQFSQTTEDEDIEGRTLGHPS